MEQNIYLQHHGILGQKWGVRRFQNPDGTWTQAGKERYGNHGNGREKTKNDISKANKSQAEAGMAVETTVALTYATFVVSAMAYVKAKQAIATSKIKKWNNNDEPIKKIVGEHSIEDDMKAVNPGYPKMPGSLTNCTYCTTAYELRRRGYDVEAKLVDGNGKSIEDVEKFWGGKSKFNQTSVNDWTELASKLEKEGDGARGNLLLWYGNKSETMNSQLRIFGGHSLVWEITNGEMHIRDCQDNKVYKGKDAVDYLNNSWFDCGDFNYLRTDNLEINWDSLKDVVMSTERPDGKKKK